MPIRSVSLAPVGNGVRRVRSEPDFASTKANCGIERCNIRGGNQKISNSILAPSLNCSCFDVLGCASVQCLVVIGKDVGVCSQFPNKARVFHNDLFIFTKILSSALADVCVSRLLLKETSLGTASLMLNEFITEKYCSCCL